MRHDEVLADVGVLGPAWGGCRGGAIAMAAPVGGLAVRPRRFHPPPAHGACQQPGQQVTSFPRPGEITSGRRAAGGVDVLGGDEAGLLSADQRRVRRPMGDNPPVRQVPPLHRPMSQGDITRVDQVAVGPLPVPHLTARIPRIPQDRGDRAQRPARACAVGVPSRGRMLTGRARPPRSAPTRSVPRNGRRAAERRSTARNAPSRDRAPDGRRGGPPSPSRYPVRRAATEIPALLPHLDRHRGPHPDARPGDFPF